MNTKPKLKAAGTLMDKYEISYPIKGVIKQRFRLKPIEGGNMYFTLFNNISILKPFNIGDNITIEYKESIKGEYIDLYVNKIYFTENSKKAEQPQPVLVHVEVNAPASTEKKMQLSNYDSIKQAYIEYYDGKARFIPNPIFKPYFPWLSSGHMDYSKCEPAEVWYPKSENYNAEINFPALFEKDELAQVFGV